jgi:hypothetical protein
MTKKPEPRRRRGTPISDGLGAELQTLGTILANHTRGLDDYLQRQAGRIETRQAHLLAESAELLLPPGQDLASLSSGELQNLCRRHRLRGWSKLRRSELIAFLQQQLGPELQAPDELPEIQDDKEPREAAASTGPRPSYPPDANRTERLLLLLLWQLGSDSAVIEEAWGESPGTSKPSRRR